MAPNKTQIIKDYEGLIQEIGSDVLAEEQLSIAFLAQLKGSTHGKEHNFNAFKDRCTQMMNRTVGRFQNPGHAHAKASHIELETRLWRWAKDNPEHWSLLVEPILWEGISSDVRTLDGFEFMSNFIVNGVMDDWSLSWVPGENGLEIRNESGRDWGLAGRIHPAVTPQSLSFFLDKVIPGETVGIENGELMSMAPSPGGGGKVPKHKSI